MRTNTSTIRSVRKSDREWTASATMAELPATIPATNLNDSSTRLPMLPQRVTFVSSFSRVMACFILSCEYTLFQ